MDAQRLVRPFLKTFVALIFAGILLGPVPTYCPKVAQDAETPVLFAFRTETKTQCLLVTMIEGAY